MAINFYCPSNIFFAPGSLKELPNVVKMYGGEKVLFLTDPGIKKIGLADRALKLLDDAGLKYYVYDQVESDPSDEMCEKNLRALQE
jgi:alcohol dehydrogenase class IV